jgi:radical SAM superfamily enzyme YgiQ (UPF0313 family)
LAADAARPRPPLGPASLRDPAVTLVAVDSPWRDPNGTFYSFSYGIHALRASLQSAADLQHVSVSLVDLHTDDPDAFFAAVEATRPTLVALSAYIWSLPVFAGLVARLKRHDPTLVVVAGGPAIRRSVLDLPPYRGLREQLDAIVAGEGEETIRQLVRHHREADWRTAVRGLQWFHDGAWHQTAAAERPDIGLYPSPYQLGGGRAGMTGYIETFRGCPIHCAFCQWGEQKSDRVHSVDYLASHLEGMRRAGVANVFFLDAAFNLSPKAFRNLVEAERQVGVLRDQVVHGHLYPTFLEEHHLEFFDSLRQVQAGVGIQSFDEDVLARMGRPFDMRKFQRVLERMRGRLDVDIELIFGLPGDTPESFWRTLERSIELGSSVKVFQCLVLPDALLERAGPLQIDFDPQTFAMRSCQGWSARELAETWQRVVRRAEQFHRPILNDDWVGFVCEPAKVLATEQNPSLLDVAEIIALPQLPDEVVRACADWTLAGARRSSEGVVFDLHHSQGPITLHVEPYAEGKRSFDARDGLAWSYRGTVGQQQAKELRRLIDALQPTAERYLPGHAETLP